MLLGALWRLSGPRYAALMAGELRVEVVERDEVTVMFKRVRDEQSAITRGWAELEQAIGSLRGRKFYGVFYDEPLVDGGAEYHVCVQVRDDDDPATLGLELGTIPGGRYAREHASKVSHPPSTA